MCMLYYSANSHRKIVHLCHCKILQRIPKENRRSFDSLEEAHAKGYRLCNCCPPVAQRLRKERSAVISFCREQGFPYKLQDGVFHIISRHDCWRIIASGRAKSFFSIIKTLSKDTTKRSIPVLFLAFILNVTGKIQSLGIWSILSPTTGIETNTLVRRK